MAEPISRSGATFDDIQKARAIRQQLLSEITETTNITKRELNPMWARLIALNPVADTLGQEFSDSMRPRGAGRE